MRALLILSVLLAQFGLMTIAKGQATAQTTGQPKTIFKTSPFSLLGLPLSTFYAGVEHRVAPQWYLNHQAGLVFGAGWLNMPDFEQLEGYRWQSGIRHYTSLFEGKNTNSYFELQGKYHYTDMLIPADFCRFDCAFQQRINYRRLERSFSLLATAGASVFFSRRIKVDIDCGMGYQWLDRTFSNVPPDASFLTNGSLYYRYKTLGEHTDRVVVSFSVVLGYILY